MAAAVSLPIVILVTNKLMKHSISNELLYFSIFAAVLIVYTHRSNIKRLLKGEERPFKRIGYKNPDLPSDFTHEDTQRDPKPQPKKLATKLHEGTRRKAEVKKAVEIKKPAVEKL